ncbi:MAG: TM1802 family CRISPR-associated protein, partial [Candidatus Helarchaeota archaeon]
CHASTRRLSGNVSPFSFYTVDKVGYIAGGFNRKGAINNFPVCQNCALLMEIGKRVLQNDLSYTIGREKCYIIPRNLGSIDNLAKFLYRLKKGKSIKFQDQKKLKEFRSEEEMLLKKIGDCNDTLTINFLFYTLSGPGNAVFSISLLIRDVLPSRIKKIYDAIERVNNFEPNLRMFGLKQNESMRFSFLSLRRLFIRENNSRINRDAYLKILEDLFLGIKVNYWHLVERFFVRLQARLYNTKSKSESSAGGGKKSKARKKSSTSSPSASLSYEMVNFLPIVKLFFELDQIRY